MRLCILVLSICLFFSCKKKDDSPDNNTTTNEQPVAPILTGSYRGEFILFSVNGADTVNTFSHTGSLLELSFLGTDSLMVADIFDSVLNISFTYRSRVISKSANNQAISVQGTMSDTTCGTAKLIAFIYLF